MVTIRSFPRVHITLLDLGDATFRKYGGAGFAISGPSVEVEASPSRSVELMGLERLDKVGRRDVTGALDRLVGAKPKSCVRVNIRSMPPQHVGLGTKTALLLAVLKAADLAVDAGMDQETLKRLSGRGGTSGIGINTFFTGGFLTDAGHDPKRSCSFVPSSVARDLIPPTITASAKIPSRWRFYLMIASGVRRSFSEERRFFRENTPIPRMEILHSLALVYHGVVPAFIQANLPLLKISVREIQRQGFKRRELQGQPFPVRNLLTSLHDRTDCAVGLSSMGPLIYAIADKDDCESSRIVKRLSAAHGAVWVGEFTGRNRGYEVVE